MGRTYEQEQERKKGKGRSKKTSEESVTPSKEKKDRGWNVWSKTMNKVSGGKLYKNEKAAHKQRKEERERQAVAEQERKAQAERERQEKHRADVAMSLPDVNENDIVKTPTGSKERQQDIHNQLVRYANDQMDQTDRVNAFAQKEYGMSDFTGFGGASRMIQGLYRNTGNEEEDYEYNRTIGDFLPKLMNQSGSSDGSDGENKFGVDANIKVASIIAPVLEDLREIQNNGGFAAYALSDYGSAKMMLGKINSIQDILKNYSKDEDTRTLIYKLSGTTKSEFSELTMGMSLAIRDAGRSMGADLGMDNISSYQNMVATQEREKRTRKRKTEYANLKANQRAYIQRKGFGTSDTSEHRKAYMALSMKDKARANSTQRGAMGYWISCSKDYSDALRGDQSIDEMIEELEKEKKSKVKADSLRFVKKQIGVMDSIFTDNAGLEESLQVYRGVGDGFLKFLFQQKGFSEKDYEEDTSKKDASSNKKNGSVQNTSSDKNKPLDYKKIDKKGLMKSLVGMTYKDNCFVSTSTNRGYCAMWANQDAFKKADDMRTDMLQKSNTKEGSRERSELERYSESVALEQTEAGKGGHMMTMHLPAGTKAIFADAFGDKEQNHNIMKGASQNEVTLDRGLIYKITGVSGSAGSYQFYVTVVGSGTKKAADVYDAKADIEATAALDTGIQDV